MHIAYRSLVRTFALGGLLVAPTLGQHIPANPKDPGQLPLGTVGPGRSRGPAAERRAAALRAPRSLVAAWSPRHVEHLLNRAGFGATQAEVRRWTKAGPDALVDSLFGDYPTSAHFPHVKNSVDRRKLIGADDDTRRELISAERRADKVQIRDFVDWWTSRMAAGQDPLVERMTLFWHGHFTSSVRTVRRSAPMIRQNDTLRRHALGNFGDLLAEMLVDPAMLVYLDNDANKKSSPNENLAREVMELFTLGVGNYTETDVTEAARALTGYTIGDQEFLFRKGNHDKGRKQILGIRGRHDATDLAEILLAQPACADHLATRLIEYFEGRTPDPERVTAYGRILREANYEIAALMRALLLDPEFYSPDVVGAKVASPVDFVIGTCRRLGVQPSGDVLNLATSILGQQLLSPPNVKGWEGGMAWLTTASMMQRGNLAGALLGVVERNDVYADDEALAALEDMDDLEEAFMDSMMTMDEVMESMGDREEQADNLRSLSISQLLRAMRRRGYETNFSLVDALQPVIDGTDAEIVDALSAQLLAIEPPAETRAMLTETLARERAERDLDEGELATDRRRSEFLLRRLAHLILSLPEAQLG